MYIESLYVQREMENNEVINNYSCNKLLAHEFSYKPREETIWYQEPPINNKTTSINHSTDFGRKFRILEKRIKYSKELKKKNGIAHTLASIRKNNAASGNNCHGNHFNNIRMIMSCTEDHNTRVEKLRMYMETIQPHTADILARRNKCISYFIQRNERMHNVRLNINFGRMMNQMNKVKLPETNYYKNMQSSMMREEMRIDIELLDQKINFIINLKDIIFMIFFKKMKPLVFLILCKYSVKFYNHSLKTDEHATNLKISHGLGIKAMVTGDLLQLELYNYLFSRRDFAHNIFRYGSYLTCRKFIPSFHIQDLLDDDDDNDLRTACCKILNITNVYNNNVADAVLHLLKILLIAKYPNIDAQKYIFSNFIENKILFLDDVIKVFKYLKINRNDKKDNFIHLKKIIISYAGGIAETLVKNTPTLVEINQFTTRYDLGERNLELDSRFPYCKFLKLQFLLPDDHFTFLFNKINIPYAMLAFIFRNNLIDRIWLLNAIFFKPNYGDVLAKLTDDMLTYNHWSAKNLYKIPVEYR